MNNGIHNRVSTTSFDLSTVARTRNRERLKEIFERLRSMQDAVLVPFLGLGLPALTPIYFPQNTPQ